MAYSEALIKYLTAYNAKTLLESNPLMDHGVLDGAKADVTGRVHYNKIVEYERVAYEIETGINEKIAEQVQIMDAQRAEILTLFGTTLTGLVSILMPGETQVIEIVSGAISVRAANPDDLLPIE